MCGGGEMWKVVKFGVGGGEEEKGIYKGGRKKNRLIGKLNGRFWLPFFSYICWANLENMDAKRMLMSSFN